MQHSFDIDIAKEYGVHAAIILNNMYFWIEKNRANEKNYFEGCYWTYNSKKAFADLIPYLTERQIDYALNKLKGEGIIITGNFNKSAYDRTMWYAITEKGYSIIQKREIHFTNLLNGNNNFVEPIPDIIQIENQINKTHIKSEKEKECPDHQKSKIDYQSIIDLYNEICTDLPKVSKLTEERKKSISARIKNGYSIDDFKTVFQAANESDFLCGRGSTWKANFDWLIKPTNIVKVMEGNYKNNENGHDGGGGSQQRERFSTDESIQMAIDAGDSL